MLAKKLPVPEPAPIRRKVIIQWGISSFFGWGVYGLNLALQWADDPDLEPICSLPLHPNGINIDPLRRRALEPFFRASVLLQEQLKGFAEREVNADRPMLMALGNDFSPQPAIYNAKLSGNPTFGVVFFETAQFNEESIVRARQYAEIVVGSTWNARVLKEYGLTNVRTVLQGIDPTLFHPAPKAGFMGDRFLVFSGGKLEHRKGQDLVLAAFKRFQRARPEALLVTAWHSPWPALARSVDQSGLLSPVTFNAEGKPDVVAWAVANEIPAEKVLDLGAIPNALLPTVLREMDVALFPNRCEGGTNLVAMECMACGVPVILSTNTGHLDLADERCCFPLTKQKPLREAGAGVGQTPGWGESDVDEIVEMLERAHRDRREAARRAKHAAKKLADLTWAATATKMKQMIGEHVGS